MKPSYLKIIILNYEIIYGFLFINQNIISKCAINDYSCLYRRNILKFCIGRLSNHEDDAILLCLSRIRNFSSLQRKGSILFSVNE